jgi:hypothetical protein
MREGVQVTSRSQVIRRDIAAARARIEELLLEISALEEVSYDDIGSQEAMNHEHLIAKRRLWLIGQEVHRRELETELAESEQGI